MLVLFNVSFRFQSVIQKEEFSSFYLVSFSIFHSSSSEENNRILCSTGPDAFDVCLSFTNKAHRV